MNITKKEFLNILKEEVATLFEEPSYEEWAKKRSRIAATKKNPEPVWKKHLGPTKRRAKVSKHQISDLELDKSPALEKLMMVYNSTADRLGRDAAGNEQKFKKLETDIKKLKYQLRIILKRSAPKKPQPKKEPEIPVW